MSRPGRHIEGTQTRERVLQAAAELMAQNGYSGTSISQISKASSTNPASIYWAFNSKEGLFAAVLERAADSAFERVHNAIPEHGDMWDSIAALAKVFEDGPEFLRLLLVLSLERRDADPEILATARRVRATAATQLAHQLEKILDLPRPAQRRAAAQRLARFTLMLLDGVFVASQIERDETDLKDAFTLISLGVRSTAEALVTDIQNKGRKR